MGGGGIAKGCRSFIHQTLWPYVPLKFLCIFRHIPCWQIIFMYPLFFDSGLIPVAHLDDGWDERPVSRVSQDIGDHWIKEGLSAILRVPSVIMPDGYNYLVNIHHPDFKKIKIGKPQPLAFDPRLQK